MHPVMLRLVNLVAYFTQLIVMVATFHEVRPALAYSYALATGMIFVTTWMITGAEARAKKELLAQLEGHFTPRQRDV